MQHCILIRAPGASDEIMNEIQILGSQKVQEKLESSYGEKPEEVEDYDESVNSWNPRPGILGRSDIPEEYLPQNPSYPYGALRIKDLLKEWQDEIDEEYETRDEGDYEEASNPSYAYGALGNKFQIDSVVVEAADP